MEKTLEESESPNEQANKYIINYSKKSGPFSFLSAHVAGFELVWATSYQEAHTIATDAIIKMNQRSKIGDRTQWSIHSIKQVDRNAKPSEMKTVYQKELEFEHEENMKKYESPKQHLGSKIS